MQLERYHKMLIGLLVVQAVLVIVVLASGGERGSEPEHALLPGFDAATVSRVQIAGDGGKLVELVKTKDAWTLASAFDYPVDGGKVGELLAALAKMSAAEPIATSPTRHKQLRVADDDFDRKITVTMGSKTATVIVGNPAGSRRYAMRFANDDDVYATTLAPHLAGAEARDWIETKYLDVQMPDVTKITIARGTGTFEMSREAADKPWTVAIDGTAVAGDLDGLVLDRIGSEVTKIDATAPADPKRDAAGAVKITIHAKDKDIVIDAIADATSYWVKDESNPRAVQVDKFRLDDVLSSATKDKVVKKPTSPPGKEPGPGSAVPIQPLHP